MNFKTTLNADLDTKEYLTAKGENWLDWEKRCEVTIWWNADIISTEKGIRSIISRVERVTGTVEMWKDSGKRDKWDDAILTNNDLLIDETWKIESDLKVDSSSEPLLQPSQVEINLQTKTIYIA